MVLGGGFDLGTAYGKIVIDASGVSAGMDQARQSIRTGLQGMGDGIQAIGSQVSDLGTNLLKITAPLAAGFGAATASAMNFDEAMTNVGAVLGKSRQDMAGLSDQILEVGRSSRYGPQLAAEAFYDIVGGVADASTHMAIFNAAIHTAQAGNADLKGTTTALISVMNGYGFSADKAGFASNVLTQTVNKGVGSMNQFAAAMPDVAGLAHAAGISFDDLGGMMAYITTKGTSASESATQLTGVINSLLKPSDAMQGALQKIGFESGAAAIKQLGLAGTFKKLKDSGEDLNQLIPRIEGMRGAIALTDEGASSFLEHFSDGLDGVTDSAEKIQMSSPAAQFDLLKSSIMALGITIGEALLPGLNQAVAAIMPIVNAIADWVKQNPELVAQIAQIVLAVAAVGTVLTVVGMVISTIGALLASPLLPIIAIVGALVLLAQHFGITWEQVQLYGSLIMLYLQYAFQGILTALQPVIDKFTNLPQTLSDASTAAQNLVNLGLLLVVNTLNDAKTAATNLIDLGLVLVVTALNDAQTAATNLIDLGLALLTTAINDLKTIATQIVAGVQDWTTKNHLLLNVITSLAEAILIVKTGMIAYNAVQAVLTAVTAATTAGTGLAAAAFAALTSPIVVTTAAIWALITAYKELQTFMKTTGDAREAARQQIAPMVASGQITQQNVQDQAFASTVAQFGGGAIGDIIARLLPAQFYSVAAANLSTQSPQPRDYGGQGLAAMPYLIGAPQQNQEIFVPNSNGQFIPDFMNMVERALSKGGSGEGEGDTFHIYVTANDYEGGRAAMAGAQDKLVEWRRSRGG